jgi:hypothetical protein
MERFFPSRKWGQKRLRRNCLRVRQQTRHENREAIAVINAPVLLLASAHPSGKINDGSRKQDLSCFLRSQGKGCHPTCEPLIPIHQH